MITFYKLYNINDSTKKIYIGSTLNFKKRQNAHKWKYYNNYNNYLYNYIKNNGEYGSWGYFILQQINYNISKIERLNIEHHYITQHNNCINKNMPGAMIRVGFLQYQYQRRNTNNTCNKCGAIYRGIHNKNVHQKSFKCNNNLIQ